VTDHHYAIDTETGVGSREEATVRLRLRGEFDLSADDSLRAALTASGSAETTVVDLAEVSFIDAATVGALLAAHAAAAGQGRTLYVMGAAGVVRRVLNILDPSQALRCGA
jgi:anti-anti-sigma factor